MPNFSLILGENNVWSNFEFPTSVHTNTIGSFPISKYLLKIKVYNNYISIKMAKEKINNSNYCKREKKLSFSS